MIDERNIHLFVPTYRIDETLEEIRICLEKGWTGLGFKTLEFEEAFKNFTGLTNAHFLNSATAGLHMAVKIQKDLNGWNDDDEIISTPLTFVSTNHAVLYENLKIVFADVDEFLTLDPKSVEARISDKTRAVLFVGIGGNTGCLPEIMEICQQNNLLLILDAAHMMGTRFHGVHVGGGTDASIFSFHAVKNLPTADSGLVAFASDEADRIARKLSWMGISKDTYARTMGNEDYKWYYDVEHVGFKVHGNSIMAAMGLVALKYVEQDNAYRRQIAAWYDEILDDTENLEKVMMAPGCESSRHLYQVMLDNRDEVMLALNEQNIFPGVHYRANTHYRMYNYAQGTCPVAERAGERIISLPMHLRLSQEDIVRIGETLITLVDGE